MSRKSKNIILIIEDSDEDFYATKRAFEKAGMRNEIRRCEDGRSALDYLHHQGKYESLDESPVPNLILLDLNLPGKDGREVLQEIRSEKAFATIPIIVLTTSGDSKDVDYCYSVGANSYIKKPVDLDTFVKAIQRLEGYWFEIVMLPGDE